MVDTIAVNSRCWIYVMLAAGLTAFTTLVQVTVWQGNAELQTRMEVTAALVALVVGFVAMVRFYSKKHDSNHEARISAIINTAADGIITISEQGLIESMNPSAQEIFGYSVEDLLGKNVEMLIPFPFLNENVESGQCDFATNQTMVLGKVCEVDGRHGNGRKFPMELTISPIDLSDGRFFSATFRDISERKASEDAQDRYVAELKRSNDELNMFAYIGPIASCSTICCRTSRDCSQFKFTIPDMITEEEQDAPIKFAAEGR